MERARNTPPFFNSNLIYLPGEKERKSFSLSLHRHRLNDLQLRPALFLFQDLLPLRLDEREREKAQSGVRRGGGGGGKKMNSSFYCRCKVNFINSAFEVVSREGVGGGRGGR